MSIFWNSAIFEIQILEGYNNFPVRIWHSMIIAARVKPKPSLKTRYGLEIQIFETWISTLKLVFFLLSPSNSYQGRKMKTRGWSPTEFVWRLCQIFSLKMAPRTKDLQCFHIKWTHCTQVVFRLLDLFPIQNQKRNPYRNR